MTTYAVLLRGINVGGINIRMADLRAALAKLPLSDVSTLAATGNVVCGSDAPAGEVQDMIEAALREQFGYDARVVILTAARLTELAGACPYPADSKELHTYITFSSEPDVLSELFDAGGARGAAGAANERQVRLGPEAMAWQVEVGATLESAISKLAAKPKYKRATTTRNLRTVVKIVDAAQHRS